MNSTATKNTCCLGRRQSNDQEIVFARYDRLKQQLKEAYDKNQEEYIRQKTKEITDASHHNKPRLVWQVVNEISGRKNGNKRKIRANSPKERLQQWCQHFQELLGQPPSISDVAIEPIVDDQLPINTEPFTMAELTTVIKTMSLNKAAGYDNIPAEVWKSGSLNEELLNICSKALQNYNIPTAWSTSEIIPLPKKGDLGVTSNYRGISLTCISAKVYNKLLLHRIRPHVEPLLRINQNGFQPNRGTVSQILTLRRLIEGIKEKNLPAVLTFVDFHKAFDSIHREKMLQILLAYGIPPLIVNAIGVMYNNTTARVKSPDGDTDFFPILAGVLQGDTLAPFLFIVTLDYAMRKAMNNAEHLGFTLEQRQSKRYPARTLTDTDFADDIALLSDNIADAEVLLHKVESAAKEIGLTINSKKNREHVVQQPTR